MDSKDLKDQASDLNKLFTAIKELSSSYCLNDNQEGLFSSFELHAYGEGVVTVSFMGVIIYHSSFVWVYPVVEGQRTVEDFLNDGVKYVLEKMSRHERVERYPRLNARRTD